ncbi:MAG: PTS sugar transporter subunit IIA [Candidatus Electryonea clarkiae]|nr:PTS sugar transporter subunit IIA [Candidatus Electryonea clarkiae]MDP8287447.1 PTS sugar transporter subunit IIA [Candidatus Electryonea clarkiae]
MKNLLKESLQPENIFLNVESEDRFSLIRRLVGLLKENQAVDDEAQLIEDAVVREEDMATGISDGIALPHARTSTVETLTVAFARPEIPIQFESADGRPADLIFFSAIPPHCIENYLKLTAYLIRLLGQEEIAEGLRRAGSASEVLIALKLND